MNNLLAGTWISETDAHEAMMVFTETHFGIVVRERLDEGQYCTVMASSGPYSIKGAGGFPLHIEFRDWQQDAVMVLDGNELQDHDGPCPKGMEVQQDKGDVLRATVTLPDYLGMNQLGFTKPSLQASLANATSNSLAGPWILEIDSEELRVQDYATSEAMIIFTETHFSSVMRKPIAKGHYRTVVASAGPYVSEEGGNESLYAEFRDWQQDAVMVLDGNELQENDGPCPKGMEVQQVERYAWKATVVMPTYAGEKPLNFMKLSSQYIKTCPKPVSPPSYFHLAAEFPSIVYLVRNSRDLPRIAREVRGKVFIKNNQDEPDVLTVQHKKLVLCWWVRDSKGNVVMDSFGPWGILPRPVFKGVSARKTIENEFTWYWEGTNFCHGQKYNLIISFWGYLAAEIEFEVDVRNERSQPVLC